MTAAVPPAPAPAPPWAAVRALFERAMELPPEARAALLADAALDEALVTEVRSLLAHELSEEQDSAGGSGGFLAQPATVSGLLGPAPAEGDRSGQSLGLGIWR